MSTSTEIETSPMPEGKNGAIASPSTPSPGAADIFSERVRRIPGVLHVEERRFSPDAGTFKVYVLSRDSPEGDAVYALETEMVHASPESYLDVWVTEQRRPFSQKEADPVPEIPTP